jgi:predicted transcriptional regulator
MKKQRIPQPTEAELEILQVLWQHGPTTVREVHDRLSDLRDIGYTTTLKNMQNMVQKRLLLRDDAQRSHVYAAAIRQKDTQRMLLDRFLDTAFGGSASQLVMQALGHQKTTPEELKQIKELINQLENKKS